MWWLNNISLLARYEWVADLGKAVKNREPAAYVVVSVCAIVIIFVVVSFSRECYRYWKGTPVEGGLYKLILETSFAIALPLLFLYELGWRLW